MIIFILSQLQTRMSSQIRTGSSLLKCVAVRGRIPLFGSEWGPEKVRSISDFAFYYTRTMYLHCHFRTGRTQGPPVNLCIWSKNVSNRPFHTQRRILILTWVRTCRCYSKHTNR